MFNTHERSLECIQKNNAFIEQFLSFAGAPCCYMVRFAAVLRTRRYPAAFRIPIALKLPALYQKLFQPAEITVQKYRFNNFGC